MYDLAVRSLEELTEYLAVEPYHVIQGEGRYIGLPTTLIRFSICNLHCNFCDAYPLWTNKQIFSASDILKRIKHNMLFTGGEPMLTKYRQQFITVIINEFRKQKPDAIAEIETNGTKEIIDELYQAITQINISPKEKRYQTNKDIKIEYKLVEQLTAENSEKFIIKFVYDTTEANKRFILSFVDRYKLPSYRVYIMPEGATIERLQETMEKACDFALQHGFIFTPRLHILLGRRYIQNWPSIDL